MSLNKAVYNQYMENSINTSSPEELIMMLYNGLIKNVMKAQTAILENQIEKRNQSIIRAQDIVHELQVSLDMKYPISESLDSLYDYIYRRLVEANIQEDGEILQEVLTFSKELRDTWGQAIKIAKREPLEESYAT